MRPRLVGWFTLALAPLAASVSRAADAPTAPAPLRVRFEAPRGGTTSQRVVTLRGRVSRPIPRVLLVVNGIPMSIGVSGSAFEQAQVLAPGVNSLRVVATSEGETASDAISLFATVPAKDLRVTLTWDTPGTDVDLWVVGPDGEQVDYRHREGRAGGTLDTDVTSGFGPETYTQARLERGTYRIRAHAFALDAPTAVEVTTVRQEGTAQEARETFRGVLLRTGDVVEVGQFVQP